MKSRFSFYKVCNTFNAILVLSFFLLFVTSSCGNTSSSENFKLIPIKQKKDGKVSLMDAEGKIVLEDEYSAESQNVFYTEGIVCEVMKDGKVKYYRIDGNKSIAIGDKEYYDGTPFFNGYAVVKKENGMLSLIDKDGKEKIANLSRNGSTNILLVGVVSEDLIRFKDEEGHWGYMNLKGEIPIKPTYTSCENFNNGMARVLKANGLFSIINTKGEEQFKGKDKFNYGTISEGLISFKENTGEKDYYGFLDMKGEKVIKDNKFTMCGQFKNGLANVREEDDDSWGVINNKGEFVGELKTKYDSEPFISNDGKIFIYDEDKKKTKVFNDKGEDLKKDLEDYKKIIPLNSKAYLAQSKSDKWTIINEEGKEIAKDQFFFNKNYDDFLSFGIRDYITLGNLYSVESSYYEFESVVKDIFKTISVKGAFDITDASTFGQILDQYKYASPNKGGVSNKNVDRSDNYAVSMYSKENDEKSKTEETTTEEASAATTADGISLASYSPENRTSNGINYSLSFNFDTYLKSYDPYDYNIKTLNKEAKISSVICDVKADYGALKSFTKALESKLTSGGWKKLSDYSYNNPTNSYTISITGSTVTLSFQGVENSYYEGATSDSTAAYAPETPE